MSGASPGWAERLVRASLTGETDAIVSERLDALICWLAGVQSPETQAISRAFEKYETSSEDAKQYVLVALDPILFRAENSPWDTLGLRPRTGLEIARKRYYRLTKIYHPDRALADERWLNRRAERLNSAYDLIRSGKARRDERTNPPGYANAGNGSSSDAPSGIGSVSIRVGEAEPRFGDWLRGFVGNASTVQRFLLVSMAVSAVLVVALFSLELQSPSGGNDHGPPVSFTSGRLETESSMPAAVKGENGRAAWTEPPATMPVDASPATTSANSDPTDHGAVVGTSTVDSILEVRQSDGFARREIRDNTPGNETRRQREASTGDPAFVLTRIAMPGGKRGATADAGKPIGSVQAASRSFAVQPAATTSPSIDPVAGEPVSQSQEAVEATGSNRIQARELLPLPQDVTKPAGVPADEKPSFVQQNPSGPVEARAAGFKEPKVTRQAPTSARVDKPATGASGQLPAQDVNTNEDRPHREVRSLLARYASYYTRGKADDLATLYADDASQERMSGRAQIRDYYERFFKLTVRREIDFRISRIDATSELYEVASPYLARFLYRGGKEESMSGTAFFVLGHKQEDLVIRAVTY